MLAEGMSGMVQEHAYWGGARDRIPASQVDAMQAVGATGGRRRGAARSGRRVRECAAREPVPHPLRA